MFKGILIKIVLESVVKLLLEVIEAMAEEGTSKVNKRFAKELVANPEVVKAAILAKL
jgi:hypothetical protein